MLLKDAVINFLAQTGSTFTLSPGQTDSQVVASSNKLSLRRNLRWVAKRTRKFSPEYAKVAENPFQGRHGISSISLANDRLLDVTQLA